MKSETIAAISTPMSDGGIGIIRISGEDAFVVADRIYQSKSRNKSSLTSQAIRSTMGIFMMME